jgi:hypothetical protein
MAEASEQADNDMAAKIAAEAVPDPGRRIDLEEARTRIEAALSAEIGLTERLVVLIEPLSAFRPTTSRAWLAPMSARPSARTCWAVSSTCCRRSRAIRRCCFTYAASMGPNSIAGINRIRGRNEKSRALPSGWGQS